MTASEPDRLPVIWEKLKVLSLIVASLAIPLVVAYIGNAVSREHKEKELSVRYVELAIGILGAEPKEQTSALRQWAVKIVNNHSKTPLSDAAEEELLRNQLMTLTRELTEQWKLVMEMQSNLHKQLHELSKTPARNIAR